MPFVLSMRTICAFTILVLALAVGCGGGSSNTPASNTSSNPTPQITVTLSPTSATVATGAQEQFTDAVTGTSNTAVTWEVNGMAGGDSTDGTINNTGLYVAPPTVPSGQVTVAAVSQADSTKSASASVTITSSSAGSPDPLGSVTASQTNCSTGGVSGLCWDLTISCPGVADEAATIKVSSPAGTPQGTIIFGVGSGGNGYYDRIFTTGTTIVTNIVHAGFTAVQISFEGPTGWLTGPGGPRKLACRYATAAQWIYDNIHKGANTAPMCATGNSAGSGLIAYSLAHYGMGSVFSMVEPTSGPPFSRIDQGCLCTAQPLTVGTGACGPRSITLCYPNGDATTFFDPAYGNNACSTQDASYADTFLNDSITSPDATLSYPKTDVHVLYGGQDGTVAVSQGWEWSSAIQSNHAISCIQDASHELPDAADAATQITNDLTTFCRIQP
jgi:hypothetical protein